MRRRSRPRRFDRLQRADELLAGDRPRRIGPEPGQDRREARPAQVGHADGPQARAAILVQGIDRDDVGVQELGERLRLGPFEVADLQDDGSAARSACSARKTRANAPSPRARQQAEAEDLVPHVGQAEGETPRRRSARPWSGARSPAPAAPRTIGIARGSDPGNPTGLLIDPDAASEDSLPGASWRRPDLFPDRWAIGSATPRAARVGSSIQPLRCSSRIARFRALTVENTACDVPRPSRQSRFPSSIPEAHASLGFLSSGVRRSAGHHHGAGSSNLPIRSSALRRDQGLIGVRPSRFDRLIIRSNLASTRPLPPA